MIINTWRDPYNSGFSPTRPKQIEINKGLTVLVGCNGAGKTTLLHNIKEELKIAEIPCRLFDNLRDGGHSAFGAILAGFGEDGDDIYTGISLYSASEGEAIRLNINRESRRYKEFINTGYFKNKQYKISRLFSDTDEKSITVNQRWLLFDATDSGVSIDSICDIKELFKLLIEYANSVNIELYIVISANEYELCRNENCFDVNSGKYLTFSDYEDYRSFILKSRAKKEKRIERQMVWSDKQRLKEEKALEKRKQRYEPKIQAIKDKALKENRDLTFTEKSQISTYERIIERGE